MDSGYIKADGTAREAKSPEEFQKAATPKSTQKKTAKCALDHEMPCACAAEADVYFIMFLPSPVERVALSPAAMKGFLKGYQRRNPKNAIVQVWEFLFDDDGDEQWPFHTITELLEHLRCRSGENGQRGSQLEVPADWHASGIYCLRVEAGTLQLENVSPGCTTGSTTRS